MSEELKPEAALEALAEVLCTERCAQAGDPPCSKVAPDEPHCDQCLGMAQAVIEHRAQPEAAPVEPVAWMYGRADTAPYLTTDRNDAAARHARSNGWPETPLYAHPPAAPTDALVEKVAGKLRVDHRILIWLGFYRDLLPAEAITEMQEIATALAAMQEAKP